MELQSQYIRLEPEGRTARSFFIRRCGPRDFKDIVSLQDSVISGMDRKDIFARTSEDEIAESLVKDVCFGVYCDGIPAAFSLMVANRPSNRNVGTYLGYDEDKLRRCVTFDSTFILPEYRGYGIQGLMMKIRESAALLLGAEEALVTVSPDNKVSLNNIMCYGFSIAAETTLYAGLKRYIMRKHLTDVLTERSNQ